LERIIDFKSNSELEIELLELIGNSEPVEFLIKNRKEIIVHL